MGTYVRHPLTKVNLNKLVGRIEGLGGWEK